MTTIAEKLTLLSSTKTAIAQAIEAKGVTIGSIPFADYPAKISQISGGAAPAPVQEWVRPADWLPLPEVLETEEKFVGLYAVDDDDSNYVAILAEGNYTVDWGDGVVEDFASGVVAEHKYTYSSLPVGSVSSRGYKQVVVTLTPQAGQSITKLDISQRPAAFSGAQRSLQWLDITISTPNAITMRIGGGLYDFPLGLLEQCTIVSLGHVADMTYMFSNCYRLQSLPLFDTSSVTNMSYMFYYCYSLQNVPFFNTSSVTNMSYMFSNCYRLLNVPHFDTSSVVFMSYMFSNCYSLQAVPLFNTSLVTNMSNVFRFCYSLLTVPLFDTSLVTNMSNMFYYCQSLQAVPHFDTSSVTNMSYMFYYCYSLLTVPLFDTSLVTNMSYMFYYCYSLQNVPFFNTSLVTNMLNIFTNCRNLQNLPQFDMSSVTNIGSQMLLGCNNVSRSLLLNTKISINYGDCVLSASALNEIFANLAVVTGQTITITNTLGAATCDRTIATAKGWTVTG